jgi:DNA-binding response OmpR family regulator
MKRIIFIDDEHGPIDLYVRALERSGFRVEHLDLVETALDHISTSTSPADFYVVDLMMPPGDAFDLETAGFGLTTGVEIHRRIRAKWPSVPILVLTNVSNPLILALLPFDANTMVEAKINVLPFELVERIRLRISGGEN